MKRFSSILLALTICALTTHSATAASTNGFSAYPIRSSTSSPPRASFQYELNSGDSTNDTVVLHNTSNVAVSVTLYPVNALTSSSGAVTFRNRTEARSDIATWITLTRTSLALQPHEEAQIPFTLSIPQAVSPGDHIGGIIAELSARPLTSGTHGVKLDIIRRFGLRITDNVPGIPHMSMQLSNISLSMNQHLRLSLKFRNNGNVAVTAHGTATVYRHFGRSESLPLPAVSLLPQQDATLVLDSHTWMFLWAHPTARIAMQYGTTGRINGSVAMWWFDWLRIAIGLNLMLALCAVLTIWLDRSKRS